MRNIPIIAKTTHRAASIARSTRSTQPRGSALSLPRLRSFRKLSLYDLANLFAALPRHVALLLLVGRRGATECRQQREPTHHYVHGAACDEAGPPNPDCGWVSRRPCDNPLTG